MLCPHCHGDQLSIHSKTPPRWICGDCAKTTRAPVNGVKFSEQNIDKEVIVVTWAQNATPVDKRFLKSLRTYLKHNKAQLLVIPGRYKNPTSTWTISQENHDWWDDEISSELLGDRIQLTKNLVACGDIRIQPTAANPLMGSKRTITGASSAIFGHPQIALDTVPTPQSKMAKLITTTGAITKPNYTDSATGKNGEFHHQLGATVVELDGDTFHIRQIIADGNGKFYDLDKLYNGDKVTKGHRPEGLVSGDFHAKYVDPKVLQAIWTDKDSLVNTLKPKAQVFHDVFDGYFGSHHHKHDPFLGVKKHFNGDNDGYSEIKDTLEKLEYCLKCDTNYITKSNHDEHLSRWLKETDWRKDPQNAQLYLETASAWVKAIKENKKFDELEFWCGKLDIANKATFLEREDVVSIKSIIISMHGDKGPNGARGSRRAFNSIGAKSIIGHGHGPGIEKGCVQVGISCIYGLEYATGSPSNWMQTCALIYPNGKTTLVNIIDGKYCKG